MTWFRSNIRRGSGLALVALALQLVLSFGHFHGVGASSALPSLTNSVIAPVAPAPDREPDQTADFCAICATVAMANAMLFAAPPALPLPQAAEFRYSAPEASPARLLPPRGAFQPRAPPVA